MVSTEEFAASQSWELRSLETILILSGKECDFCNLQLSKNAAHDFLLSIPFGGILAACPETYSGHALPKHRRAEQISPPSLVSLAVRKKTAARHSLLTQNKLIRKRSSSSKAIRHETHLTPLVVQHVEESHCPSPWTLKQKQTNSHVGWSRQSRPARKHPKAPTNSTTLEQEKKTSARKPWKQRTPPKNRNMQLKRIP